MTNSQSVEQNGIVAGVALPKQKQNGV